MTSRPFWRSVPTYNSARNVIYSRRVFGKFQYLQATANWVLAQINGFKFPILVDLSTGLSQSHNYLPRFSTQNKIAKLIQFYCAGLNLFYIDSFLKRTCLVTSEIGRGTFNFIVIIFYVEFRTFTVKWIELISQLSFYAESISVKQLIP